MADLRTTEELDVDGFTVRIAQQKDEARFEAAVVERPKTAVNSFIAAATGDNNDRKRIDDAPICEHSLKYVAAGHAVQEYVESKTKEEDTD